MAQNQKFQGRATTVIHHPLPSGAISGIYRQTEVCTKHSDGRVTLNSGGWRTATTKMRFNQFANEFCGGRFNVYAKGGKWFVRKPAAWHEAADNDGYTVAEYFDGMVV